MDGESNVVRMQNPLAFIRKVESLETVVIGAIALGIVIALVALALSLTVIQTNGTNPAAYVVAIVGGVGGGFTICAAVFLTALRGPTPEDEPEPSEEDSPRAA